ncbi:MAG: alpha/beta hydrolase [Bacteroidota bacterium]
MQLQTITTPRGTFAYRSQGLPDPSPLVLLHGWPESSFCWEGVVAELPQSWSILAPDLRGLGDSERTPEVAAYDKLALAKDMIALLDELGIEQFRLVGHDWGGAVAQEMVRLIPERISRLGLINISIIFNLKGNLLANQVLSQMGFYPYWYQYIQQQKGLFEGLVEGRERLWLEYFLRRGDGGPLPEASLAEYTRYFQLPGTLTASANYYRSFRADRKRWATYGDYRCPVPTHYLYGNQDRIIIPEFLQHAEECFDEFHLHEIGTGHFVMEEQPAEVARFLEKGFD